ncbi:hypothetical protein [Pseudomonas umsongensis]|uniref:hypothetical protein n=1 Tax=Pseudomonas umsongensis TaxID=198618 RepID=UPI0015BA2E34|nr:hypothetical protein [Pseudomonas umsongensis]
MRLEDELHAHGVVLTGELLRDGKPHWLPAQGAHARAWYVCFSDGSGCWGSWSLHGAGVCLPPGLRGLW